ncbi:DEAD/DEAH box helicase family protein [Pseudoalteromonas sp. SG41-1]|uniref:DEAD/DEAH box helicase family protein n=1 Tax=Pseudoalteromonas sp. SG41-1 TaxID=2760979 RepID=UPI001602840A|nr:DEAD/DEAH box helicase family protein [Pseudoalteromonas sp. SG41-1]MBB1507538.1 DEAD/DEAH box helicase family protein [Pseudoalteromonas sp. SG41-1]
MVMLHEKLTTYKEMTSEDAFSSLVGKHITDNLNPKFEIRPYQYEAFGRFEFHYNKHVKSNPDEQLNVLYHMATGSGKTLIMAGEILTLYRRGYRNFLFFVNSTNIIRKTKENFINKSSSKYLFNDEIIIDNEKVFIKEVDNFATANPDNINIVFTTIQNLHMVMSAPRENSLTIEDFKDNKVVLISDEAHHINVETKKKVSNEELLIYNSWESTVKRIYNACSENIMLEFTATAELTDPAIAEKYKDIVIFDYPLKEFRIDGYSKEVKVVQVDSEPLNRALQAVIVSQYRRKIFEKNKILIKPVVLFKEKTIKGSKEHHQAFLEMINNLTANVLEEFSRGVDQDGIVYKAFQYFENHNISLESLALELQGDFGEENTLEVNSKESVEFQQILLNSLEDKDNEIRAIFAVDKLNEGWDVLNLFDIVRLYDVRSPKETIKEAQLIGRGARYCPFRVNDEQPLYQRKYDILDNTQEAHELKVCEELYYYSAHNPKYIQELNKTLREIGITPHVSIEIPLKLKETFKETEFYQSGFVYTNKRLAYDRSDVEGIDNSLINTTYSYSVKTNTSSELNVFDTTQSKKLEVKNKTYYIKDFGSHVIRKALSMVKSLSFNNLLYYFPNLSSINEFINSDAYLGRMSIKISAKEDIINNLPQIEKLNAVKSLLLELSNKLDKERVDFIGSTEFSQEFVKTVFKDKILNIVNDGDTNQEFGIAQSSTFNRELVLDLSNKDWFAFNDNYGTSEEKYLVKYIDEMISDLKNKYDEVYLLRNERHLRIYSFDDGRPFEPDFVLFLNKKSESVNFTYQIFIEPKGEHLIEKDRWKEQFLVELKVRHRIRQVWQGKHFIVWGMPFFNQKLSKKIFEPAFNEVLNEKPH